MVFAGKSDLGRKRESNQDNFIVKRLSEDIVFLAVCDGMGGAEGGNIASGIAIEVMTDCVSDYVESNKKDGVLEISESDARFLFNKAMNTANEAVYNISRTTPVLKGMGTTAVCALVCSAHITIGNVGDSRLYYCCGSDIEQITHDHSYVQYLVDIGEISNDEAVNNPNKNIITRAIGIDDKVDADIFAKEAESGAKLLLCTDGLSNNFTKNELCAILNGEGNVNDKLDILIALANERSGADNITAVIADFSE